MSAKIWNTNLNFHDQNLYHRDRSVKTNVFKISFSFYVAVKARYGVDSMIFREHLYWSLIAFSLSMVIFTAIFDYRHVGLLSYVFMIGVFVMSIIPNEYANALYDREQKARKESEHKKRAKDDVVEQTVVRSTSKTQVVCRLITYSLLAVLVTFCFWVSSPATDNPFFLVAGIIGAAFGQHIPDLDNDVVDDMRFHRNPITHSGIPIAIIVLLALLMIPDDYVSLQLLMIGIALGVASHLFADHVETHSTLVELLIQRPKWSQCPGDIRHIREDRQRDWLTFHGFILIFYVILLFARFQLAAVMEYPIFMDGDNFAIVPFTDMSFFIVAFTIVYYLLSLVFLVAWRKKKGDKKEKKVVKKRQMKTVKS